MMGHARHGADYKGKPVTPAKKSKKGKATKISPPLLGATLTATGVSLSFSEAYLPEVLHTIAFSMAGHKPKR
jgi:hypothetical protein